MIIIFLAILIYLFLIYIVTAELFVVGLKPDNIAELAANKRSRWIAELLQNPRRFSAFFIITRLIASSLAIVLLFYILYDIPLIRPYPTPIRFILAFLADLALYLLLSHIFPFSLLRLIPEHVLSGMVYFPMFLYKVFYPLAVVWEKLIEGGYAYDSLMCRGYLEKPIDAENISKTLQSEEIDIMRHIFDFGETITKEVMIPRIDVVAVPVETKAFELVQLIKQTGHSRIPVYRETIDEIVGVVYAKDLLIAMGCNPEVEIEKIMREPYFVPEVKPVVQLFHEMKNNRIHFAIVVDEYGGTAGIVTLEDLIEELVGEIEDEYDKDEKLITQIDNRTFVISGKLLIADINEELEFDLPEEEADTIGGFLLKLKGDIPKQGERFSFGKYKFEVLETRKNRIIKVKIRREE